uniref:Xaa-Pro aminopeptidase 1 (Trinotate prediction) n=1 Tax=Myxobolus squamalis TaxID=59785 RepID=A0A6B2G0W4_MYXSQ
MILQECYTLVLKGHISLARAIFPKGSKGSQMDSFAREHLWNYGLNFLHGTGHGIGMFLNVHEGPQRISPSSSDSAFEIGNVLSNEPGYYENGKFGIRIENMMTVVPISTKYNFNETTFFGFETLSFIPMDLNLIDASMLDCREIHWLNNYHMKCLEYILPELEKFNFTDGIEFLRKNTCQLKIN